MAAVFMVLQTNDCFKQVVLYRISATALTESWLP